MWRLTLDCTSNLNYSYAWNPVRLNGVWLTKSWESIFTYCSMGHCHVEMPFLINLTYSLIGQNHPDPTTTVLSHLPIHVILPRQDAIFDWSNPNLNRSNLHKSELFKGFLSKFNALLIKSLQAHCAPPFTSQLLYIHYIIYTSLKFIYL
jgi:hypothetical protein